MRNRLTYRLSFTLLAAFLFMSFSGFTQEDEESECARALRKARKTYEDGLIEKVEQMIDPCLKSGQLNKEEQLEGYRLLALSKLYDDKDEEAEMAMLKFLSIDPEYELQPGVDPKEFSELFTDFHTSPLYTIGIQGGLNWTMINSYVERGLYNTETEKKSFSSNIGFQVGAKVSRYIYGGWQANLDFIYIQNKYTYIHNILDGISEVSASEVQNVIGVPLTLSYTFNRFNQIRPYALAGIGIRYILSAEQQDHTKDYPGSNIASVTGPPLDIKGERNELNFEGIFGAGIKLKIPRGDVFLEGRYNMGLSNQRNESSETALNDDERLWNFYISDNDFTMNNVYVSIGFNYYLYKPRKKKEKDE